MVHTPDCLLYQKCPNRLRVKRAPGRPRLVFLSSGQFALTHVVKPVVGPCARFCVYMSAIDRPLESLSVLPSALSCEPAHTDTEQGSGSFLQDRVGGVWRDSLSVTRDQATRQDEAAVGGSGTGMRGDGRFCRWEFVFKLSYSLYGFMSLSLSVTLWITGVSVSLV